MLVCASFFFTRKSAPSADGIPPLGDGNADFIWRAPFIVGSTLAWNPYSTPDISSSQSLNTTTPLMGFSPLGIYHESNSAAGISPIRRSKVYMYH